MMAAATRVRNGPDATSIPTPLSSSHMLSTSGRSAANKASRHADAKSLPQPENKSKGRPVESAKNRHSNYGMTTGQLDNETLELRQGWGI